MADAERDELLYELAVDLGKGSMVEARKTLDKFLGPLSPEPPPVPEEKVACPSCARLEAERDEARKALESRRFSKGWEASVWTPLTKLLSEHGYVPGTGGDTYVGMLEKILATAQANAEEAARVRALLVRAKGWISNAEILNDIDSALAEGRKQ